MRGIYVNAADHANLSLLAVAEPLRGKLQHAQVVPSSAVPPDVVTMQSTVLLVNEDSGERRLLSLVYPQEAELAPGRLSVLDPLGMELFGARLGEHLVLADASGRQRYHVSQILYQPEQSMRTHLVARDERRG